MKDSRSADFDRERWLEEHDDPRFGDWDPRPDDRLRRRLAIDPENPPPSVLLPHVERLRRCAIYAAIAVAAGACIAVVYISEIVAFAMRPMHELLPPGGTLVYMDPGEAFVLHVKIAVIAGATLAFPAVMLQAWRAVAPPFRARQRIFGLVLIAMSLILFVAGAAFSHYVVFPAAWRFFVSFTSDTLEFRPQVARAFSMYLRLLVAFGVLFQMPTLVLFLTRMRMITAGFLRRNFKYAVLIMVVVAAVITPDGGGVSLVAMMVPMIALYAFSIGLAWAFAHKSHD